MKGFCELRVVHMLQACNLTATLKKKWYVIGVGCGFLPEARDRRSTNIAGSSEFSRKTP